jgi:succinoglycan biosynthesis protein ExoO
MAELSIIIPACHAQSTIGRAVCSVIDQPYDDWELWIIADDGQDYDAWLEAENLRDPRIQFASTGQMRSGAANAINIGLRHATAPYVARLCADDTYAPNRLVRMMPAVHEHGIVTCGLALVEASGVVLGEVGTGGKSCFLRTDYKQVNLSADGMVVYDRRIFPHQMDEALPLMSDLDFILKCFEITKQIFHISEPLYRYYKHAESLSYSPYALHMEVKQELLSKLQSGGYNFANPQMVEAMELFFEQSMQAEDAFEQLRQRDELPLFEALISQVMRRPAA